MDENVNETYLEGLYNERDAILELLRRTDSVKDQKTYFIYLTVIDRLSKQIAAEEERFRKESAEERRIEEVERKLERDKIEDERKSEEIKRRLERDEIEDDRKSEEIKRRLERDKIEDERYSEEVERKLERYRIEDERYSEEQAYKKANYKNENLKNWVIGLGIPVASMACYMIFGLAQRGWEENGNIFTTKVQNIFKPKL